MDFILFGRKYSIGSDSEESATESQDDQQDCDSEIYSVNPFGISVSGQESFVSEVNRILQICHADEYARGLLSSVSSICERSWDDAAGRANTFINRINLSYMFTSYSTGNKIYLLCHEASHIYRNTRDEYVTSEDAELCVSRLGYSHSYPMPDSRYNFFDF